MAATTTSSDAPISHLTRNHYFAFQIYAVILPPAVFFLCPRPDRPRKIDLRRNIILLFVLWIPAVIHASLYLLDAYRVGKGKHAFLFRPRPAMPVSPPVPQLPPSSLLSHFTAHIRLYKAKPRYRAHQLKCPQCKKCEECFNQHVRHCEARRKTGDPLFMSPPVSIPPSRDPIVDLDATSVEGLKNRDHSVTGEMVSAKSSLASERSVSMANPPKSLDEMTEEVLSLPHATEQRYHNQAHGKDEERDARRTYRSGVNSPLHTSTPASACSHALVPPDHSRSSHRSLSHHSPKCKCYSCTGREPRGSRGIHVQNCMCDKCKIPALSEHVAEVSTPAWRGLWTVWPPKTTKGGQVRGEEGQRSGPQKHEPLRVAPGGMVMVDAGAGLS